MRLTWDEYYQPTTLDAALHLLAGFVQHGGGARVVAGGTDVLVELSRDIKPASTLIDISRITELRGIRLDGDMIELGGLTTHNDVIASQLCVDGALPLAQACIELGAPQLRNRATIAGNLVTASPANDTISALIALDASLVLTGPAGSRTVKIGDFFTGFRATVLQPDELITTIRIPRMSPNQHGLFFKLGLRRAQAISVIHGALVLTFDGETVTDARIAVGCLAPMVVRAGTVERFLVGKRLDPVTCADAGRIALQDVSPIDDIRGSAMYRLQSLERLIAHSLLRLARCEERDGWPDHVILLDTENNDIMFDVERYDAGPLVTIETTINGRAMSFSGSAPRKTLLDLVREDAGLTGAKEGCAEGECGACTVWLGGQAVMSCLVPASQAHGASVTTIEGLGNGETGEDLHPLQQAFIDEGAVQCGFCIPGMIMAGAKLLEERPEATNTEALTAVSGNICRCTGYRKILSAIAGASATAIEPRATP
ncbi:MAG: FAD binding domain-containing protein [Chloroflexota bacterium]|nr:FAD binding domain-containing protein [Chloroflexota bacterium]